MTKEARCTVKVADTGNPDVDICHALISDGECVAGHGSKAAREPIDLTPSWVAVVSIYLEVLVSNDAGSNAKKLAYDEILRAAKLADLYVKEHKR